MKGGLLVLLAFATASCLHYDEEKLHPKRISVHARTKSENDAEFWNYKAQQTLNEILQKRPNLAIAKNIILFLGDGMSIPTLSASRLMLGGESEELSFEKFPYSGLSKTYCVDYQVADSACTSTAYLGGVKGNVGTVGVTAAVEQDDCEAMLNTTNHVSSIASWFQNKNKATGFVTTARVTHASPAGVYAHTASRLWESDTDVLFYKKDPSLCHDNARQLIHNETGSNLNVIFGGGRVEFLPNSTTDPQGNLGYRSDGRDLIQEYLQLKNDQNKKAEYIWNRDQLLNLTNSEAEYFLGLFAGSHMSYNLERDVNSEPSLEEMTEAAIKILGKHQEGFFLFVEGAKIDMSHHETWAKKALDETLEFAKAVEKAVELTSDLDTLIVVTADHAHTMTYNGYGLRGNDILGIVSTADDGLPYTTLSYANGPGFKPTEADGSRHDVLKDDLHNNNYRFPSTVPLESETHGGDDVAIFSQGPWSHLFTGSLEQNVIPHLMAYASCVGQGRTACQDYPQV